MTVRGATAAALFLLVMGQPAAAQPQPDWMVTCARGEAERRCTVSSMQSFADNRGGFSQLSLSFVRDAECTTLHIQFDAPITVTAPVSLAIGDAPPQPFYTMDELTRLAEAMDWGRPLAGGPPEFKGFLAQLSEGALKSADPSREMIARFAAIKEPRRISLTCAPTERLLPLVRSGGTMRLAFQLAPRNSPRPYHWPSMTARTVDIRLDGLAEALDQAMATH
jgi:hypothetical protein